MPTSACLGETRFCYDDITSLVLPHCWTQLRSCSHDSRAPRQHIFCTPTVCTDSEFKIKSLTRCCEDPRSEKTEWIDEPGGTLARSGGATSRKTSPGHSEIRAVIPLVEIASKAVYVMAKRNSQSTVSPGERRATKLFAAGKGGSFLSHFALR